MEEDAGPKQNLTSAVLPWIVAGVALIIYLLTINPWISLGNLSLVARVSGWIWDPDLEGPLFWLLTYPFRFLPAASLPLGLNVFAAVCASLTLGLLARSITLLPHDRTHEQRERERSPFALLSIPNAWVAPVLAVLVCGLQLTFWDAATSGSGGAPRFASSEMLDLLLFAYVIRCLLEYRISERESWLTRASFVYALGITNNWAMIGFFPLFIAAMIWIRGFSFFDPRFLVRMFVWGVAGLLLYLVLPFLQSHSSYSHVDFWPALKYNLYQQGHVIMSTLKGQRKLVLLLSLTSILPVLMMGIRWASFSGDTSQAGNLLTKLMFQVVHAVFLGGCLWVGLDPSSSPRNQSIGIPFLSFYYLAALSIGYFSGYFLLLAEAPASRWRRPSAGARLMNQVLAFVVWAALLVMPTLLVFKNLPEIRSNERPLLAGFSELLLDRLPAQKGVVLSDDFRELLFAEAAASRAGRDLVFLHTGSLQVPNYHRYLKTRYKDWPVSPAPELITPYDQPQLVQLAAHLAETRELYYLHPSFGYYFEAFYVEPQGLVYRLKPMPEKSLLPPAPTQAHVDENRSFWIKADQTALPRVVHAMKSTWGDSLFGRFFESAHFPRERNATAELLGAIYSRAANFWAVELQKQNSFTNAAPWFERALELNSQNVVSEVNLICNRHKQLGHRVPSTLPRNIDDKFTGYRDWNQLIVVNGPFDHPSFCTSQGRMLVQGGNFRQAAQPLARALELDPDEWGARTLLSRLYVQWQDPEKGLAVFQEGADAAHLKAAGPRGRSELIAAGALAHLARKEPEAAESLISSAVEETPKDTNILSVATSFYLSKDDFTNALRVLEKHLQVAPTDPGALLDLGSVQVQLKAYDRAIEPLNKLLSLQNTNYVAMFNRAIAYLATDRLDEAQKDYKCLTQVFPNAFQVYYGLAEIAYRRKDAKTAIHNYELYLSKNPPAQEAEKVTARLKELNSSSP